MRRNKLFIYVTDLTKKILLFTAIVSVSQCSTGWGYEVPLEKDITNLIWGKKKQIWR